MQYFLFDRENIENNHPQKVIRKDGIYTDPSIVSTPKNILIDVSTQTDDFFCNEKNSKIQKVKEMLTSGKIYYIYK